MDVSYIGNEPGEIESRLDQVALSAGNRTNQALLETAKDIKDELEKTSPEDTGEYKNSWYVFPVDTGEVWILNEAEHAKYVMLPNSNFQGKSTADVPSQGILHNVKGVAKGRESSFLKNMADELEGFIESLGA